MDFYLQRLHDALTSVTEGMTPEQRHRHPEGKWCPAEILEHLYLTYTGTLKGFEKCLSAGKPLASGVTIRDRIRTFVVINLGYLPEGRKAPKNTTPKGGDPESVAADIFPKIALMDVAIQRCEEAYGRNTKLLDHPILGPLTGTQWRKFHWIHGRHHVKQIEALRQREQ